MTPGKKLVLLLTITLAVTPGAVSAFDRDLLHLESVRQGATTAYLKTLLTQTWELLDFISPTFSPTAIGIVDSGIEKTHPEFSSGVEFGTSPPSALIDNDPEGHGTAVAGIIGANNLSKSIHLPDNSRQMNGIVSGVEGISYVMEARNARFLNVFAAAVAIRDLASKRTPVINISRGTKIFPIATVVFDALFQIYNDTLFILGAGNDNTSVSFVAPANLGFLENVVSVGASTLNDTRVGFSNFGPQIGLAAPGEDVYAPVITVQNGSHIVADNDNVHEGLYDGRFSGTSAATPMVTGVAAILKALEPEYQKYTPGLAMSPGKIKEVLVKSADPIQTGEPDKRIGTGCYADPNDPVLTGCRLNAHRAVAWYLPPKAVENLTAADVTSSFITLDWAKPPDFDLHNPDFDSYRIYRDTSPGVDTGDTLVAIIPAASTLSFTDTNLSPNTTYFYKVFVFDRVGLSSPSNEVSARTQSAGPLLEPLFTIPGDPAQSFLPIGATDSLILAQGIWDHTDMQNGVINGVRLYLGKVGSPNDELVVELGQSFFNRPIGDRFTRLVLASSTVSLAALPASPAFSAVDVIFPVGIPTLEVNAVFLHRTGMPDASNYPVARADNRGPSARNPVFTCSPDPPFFFCLESTTFPAHGIPLALLGAPGAALPGSRSPRFQLLFGLEGNPLNGSQGIGLFPGNAFTGQTLFPPDVTAGTLREISVFLGRVGNPTDDAVISLHDTSFLETLASASLPASTLPPLPAFRKVTLPLFPAIGSRDANLFRIGRSGLLDNLNFSYVRHEDIRTAPFGLYPNGTLFQCTADAETVLDNQRCFGSPFYDVLVELYGDPSGGLIAPLSISPSPLLLPPVPDGMGTSTVR